MVAISDGKYLEGNAQNQKSKKRKNPKLMIFKPILLMLFFSANSISNVSFKCWVTFGV
jgi:hypothetical protein